MDVRKVAFLMMCGLVMLWGMDYTKLPDIQPRFFRAVMHRGVIDLTNCEVIQ